MTDVPQNTGERRGGEESAQLAGATETSLPSLIEIRHDEAFPLVLDHTHRIATEAFGILRSRVLRAHLKYGIRSIVFTSPGMSQGKSLISVNLALSFGHLGQKRVLLVDGDLRASGATRMLKLEKLPGLADLLLGKATPEEAIRATNFPHLSLLPAGNVPEKALPELLAGSSWKEFLESAKQQYDLILIDTVPVTAPVVDLELLAASCDAALLVVQIRKTTRESLEAVPKRLDRQKLLGVVINNADAISDYTSGYYNYYRLKPR
jgi:capsular exopolysaccharide synthesis family protein